METVHCSGCDYPMTRDEIAYEVTGSLLVDPIFYCDACKEIHASELDVEYDYDVDDFLTDYAGYWDDE